MPPAADRSSDLSAKLRSLPSVDRVLSDAALEGALAAWDRSQVVDAVRLVIDDVRLLLASGLDEDADSSAIAARACGLLESRLRPSLRRAINATGVVIHTNLGRAPVSEAAARAMSEAASGYSNLEFDLEGGTRGSRAGHLEGLLSAVTGAETGVAVNNNAAALYLTIAAHCAGREVIVSRGQAVEIGGGFRIPDVLRDAGAELVEVGTTNRTRASDYADAISERTAAVLRVHSSNFRIVGFTEEPPIGEMRSVATEAGALLIDDVGSGALLDTREFGLSHEPRPQDSIAAGADLALFSGDKLLGGPQAGIIVGKREAVEPLRRHPLMRVLRPDKTAIAGLAATLQHYASGEARSEVPVWRMISASAEALRERAETWRAAVGAGDVAQAESAIGGGSLPGETLPTFVWSLPLERPSEAARALRSRDVPVVARVERDRLLLDPRTVLPGEGDEVAAALREIV